MSLPQLRLCLEACKRRDAEQGLQSLDVVHSAIAPLLAGRDGTPSYESCLNRLRDVLFRTAKPQQPSKAGPSWFSKLVASAIPRTAVKLTAAEESFVMAARAALGRK